MLVFGMSESRKDGDDVINVLCKNCGHTHHVSFGLSRYIHLFWIPLIITSRQVGLRCTHCDKTTKNDEVPLEVQERVRKNLFAPLKSLPLYSGSIILIIALSLLYVAHLDNRKDERALLQAPQMHDVYAADLSRIFPEHSFGEFSFGAMRVVSVKGDGILFAISKDSFSDILTLSRKISREGQLDDFYGNEVIFLSNEAVINFYNTETIRSITRDFRPEKTSNPIKW